MSHECHRELESTVTKTWDVDVMAGKANLEVRPTFINKGEISKRLVRQYNEEGEKVEFVLCLGDDFTDEDMFRALNGLSAQSDDAREIEPEHCFTVTVGASTRSPSPDGTFWSQKTSLTVLRSWPASEAAAVVPPVVAC